MKGARAAPANPRRIAADIVGRVLDDEGAHAAPLLDAALSGAALDDADRALATELTYGTLRWALALDESVRRALTRPEKRLDAKLRAHLLVGAYQLLHLDDRIPIHAAVNETVALVKRERPGLAGLANAVLRHLGSPLHLQLPPGAPLDALARATGTPLALAEAIIAGLPDDERLPALLALHARPPLGVFVRGGDARRDAFVDALAGVAKRARAHPFVPGTALVDGAGRVPALAGFSEGEIVVLDPGSALVALVTAPARGDRVLDLCAAPGSKTMILADRVSPSGKVTAVELHPARAERIRENARRLDLPVEVVVGDGADPAVVGDALFDAVLVDAPCSGLGTTRRRPEIALRAGATDKEPLPVLQRRLLEAAAARVRPGGTLVYAVCTPIPAEGEAVVRDFLRAHDAFVVEDAGAAVPTLPPDARGALGFVALRPHRHDADAFFIARLHRRS